jgi:hypothetical protein
VLAKKVGKKKKEKKGYFVETHHPLDEFPGFEISCDHN